MRDAHAVSSFGSGGRHTKMRARRHDVLVQERRRYLQRAGDVVETFADIVAGQQRRGIYLDAQQVAHGIGVLGAIQAVDANSPWVGVSSGGLVERVFQIGSQRVGRIHGRPRRSGRRHHPAAQLADRPLPDQRVLFRMGKIEQIQRQFRGLETLIVAGDTVPVDQRLMGFDPGRRWSLWRRGVQHAQGDRGEQQFSHSSGRPASYCIDILRTVRDDLFGGSSVPLTRGADRSPGPYAARLSPHLSYAEI